MQRKIIRDAFGLWLLWVLPIPISITPGCAAPVASAPAPAATQPVADRACFRAAQAKDLRILISTRKAGLDGFPVAGIQLWNNSPEEVIVQYDSASVVLHCGPFEQHGPANVLGRRREILDPQEELDFEMPQGHWARSAANGERDLMLPSDLPRGNYPMWATFRVAAPAGGTVESDRDQFDAP